MRLVLLGALSLASLIAASGCLAVAAAGAGVGTYAYIEGDLEKDLEAPIERVYEAALAVMEEMQYTVNSSTKDALEARVSAEQADETAVRISLTSKTDSLTRTRVRVGFFGDEAQSARIMEKMESRLGL